MTYETVRQMARELADVEEGTSYGTPALRVRRVLFVRLREDGDSLVVRMERDRREELIAADPEVYYLTDHYLEYPWVLVRLSRVHPDALGDLLRHAWELAASSQQAGRKKKRP